MDHRAHGLDLEHPIFNTPSKVSFEWAEDNKAAKHYAGATSVRYPKGVGDTFKTTPFEKPGAYNNATLVNHEGFFTDVPGLENIAEGCSGKELGSLAIARQGKHFYWGYSIDPDILTDPAKLTLVNALHYLHSKLGSRTVSFVATPRRILWIYVELNRRMPQYKRGLEEHMPNSLTDKAKLTYTDRTLEGATKWLETYLDYIVFSGKGDATKGKSYAKRYEIDEDARTLGTPNAKRESLETWMTLAGAKLAKGEDSTKQTCALACLKRYVHADIFPANGDWNAWYAKYRDRIVFIESTGFWWQENPTLLPEIFPPAPDTPAPKSQPTRERDY